MEVKAVVSRAAGRRIGVTHPGPDMNLVGLEVGFAASSLVVDSTRDVSEARSEASPEPAGLPDNSDATRARFVVAMAPRAGADGSDTKHNDVMNITLEFTATDPPEGVMRVIDAYTNKIIPGAVPPDQAFPQQQPVRLRPPPEPEPAR